MPTAKRKRLVQGKDFQAWAWKPKVGDWKGYGGPFAWWSEKDKPLCSPPNAAPGKWVRVKFVEVT